MYVVFDKDNNPCFEKKFELTYWSNDTDTYIHSPRDQHKLKKCIVHEQRKWIKEDKKNQYRLRDINNVYVTEIHLLHRLHPVEFDVFDVETRQKIS